MTSKHTPGPWSLPHFAEPETNCECGYVLTDGYMGAVATVHCSGEGNWRDTGDNPKFDEAVANARLIAAAPDLLEALTAVQQACLFDHDDGSIGVSEDVVIPSDLFNQICKVIAKATGGKS